jgi:hypothetical protein
MISNVGDVHVVIMCVCRIHLPILVEKVACWSTFRTSYSAETASINLHWITPTVRVDGHVIVRSIEWSGDSSDCGK